MNKQDAGSDHKCTMCAEVELGIAHLREWWLEEGPGGGVPHLGYAGPAFTQDVEKHLYQIKVTELNSLTSMMVGSFGDPTMGRGVPNKQTLQELGFLALLIACLEQRFLERAVPAGDLHLLKPGESPYFPPPETPMNIGGDPLYAWERELLKVGEFAV